MCQQSDCKLVSVIIPVYNMDRFVQETLDSVLASDYPNFEVIVVDDGSTDNSNAILREYERKNSRIHLFSQPNRGVSSARNKALEEAKGDYILPVDADNIIFPHFITSAVEAIEANPSVKVVVPRIEYFGKKSGEWILPDYSLSLLARKNIIDNCALYRRMDALEFGGYCTEVPTREDWDFWISMLKNGGEVFFLDSIGFKYRARSDSEHVLNRGKLYAVIDILNSRHPEFFERELYGKLRKKRTLSKAINLFIRLLFPRNISISSGYESLEYFIKSLSVHFDANHGNLIHYKRNQLRILSYNDEEYVVKRFAKPNFFNSLIYGSFRKSKAMRSFLYAQKLLSCGIPTPEPIAFSEINCTCFLLDSFYVSRRSTLKYSFYDVINNTSLEHRIDYLTFIGEQTAEMHMKGIYPLDFSGGNILIDFVDGAPVWQMVDLNRMKFCDVDIHLGCKGFERLNPEPEALDIIATAYAQKRGFDIEECKKLIRNYRWKKHNK